MDSSIKAYSDNRWTQGPDRCSAVRLAKYLSDIGTLNKYHYVQEFPVVKIPVIFVSVHINIDKESK